MSNSAYSSGMSSSSVVMSGSGVIPIPTGAGAVSPDGSCGGANAYTCIGYSMGECCGSLGYW